jgi:hypothetical protein
MQHLTAGHTGILSILLISSALIFILSCKKVPPATISAKGFLASAEMSCSPSKVHGIWYNGISKGTDTNYVEVTLNITSPGSYNIKSGEQNGVTFSGSGTINSIGAHTVRLKSSGTFINWGPTSFPITFDSSSCNFIIYAQDRAALSMPVNTWEVTASGNYYNGPCRGAFNSVPEDVRAFIIVGTGSSGRTEDTVMGWQIAAPGSILDTIPYLTSDERNSFYIRAMDTSKSFPDSYLINAYASTLYPPSSMELHIRSIVPWITDDTYRTVVYGTFDGTAVDLWHQNHVVPITGGRFKVIY